MHIGEGRGVGIAEIGIGIDQGHGVEGRGLLAAEAEGIESKDSRQPRLLDQHDLAVIGPCRCHGSIFEKIP